MIDKAQLILKRTFGYDEFRPLQKEIIDNILKKRDTLVIMPTGGGKSICYQIPALIFPGLTVVVSPLISLMKDQVEQLMAVGVDAIYLNSSLPPSEYSRNIEKIRQNRVKMLYLAPETLLKPDIINLLALVRVDCLAIDEAHCISEWGHDFRPEYRQLSAVRARFPDSVCVALTATATPRVQKDIKASLNFDDSNEFIGSFNRENLFIRVVSKKDPLSQTIHFLKKFPDQSGIIYCFSRRQVDELYEVLEDEGFSVRPYHAGLSETDRKKNQEMFIKDDVQIIVATIAFGMGINKPNVRFVIHYDLPKNIESYYQEIGRAGRDGLRAECLLLLSYADIQKIKFFINQKNDHEKRVATIHLKALLQFAESEVCRRIPLLTYFGEAYSVKSCDMCDNCLAGEIEQTDITIAAQKFLSCVKKTGEMFGAGHIIDVLRGSTAKKVMKFGHQNLSTYGIGKDVSKNRWFHLSRQFLHKGLMEQDMEYGGLRLTQKAWDVFKGNEIVMGRLEEEPVAELNGKDREKKADLDHDATFFEILRKKRKELADKANVPPYVIFSDKTLIEIAAYFPQTINSLRNIFGIGEEKLKKYGITFLEIIREYCGDHHIAEKSEIVKKTTRSSKKHFKKLRHMAVGEAYNDGQSISGLMAAYSIKQVTVIDHLFKYIKEGHALRPDGLIELSIVTPEQKTRVFKTFDELGTDYLSPVYQALNEEVSYDELKILCLYYLSANN